MTPNEPLLTVEEVAALVRQDCETVRRWAREKSLPAIKLPGGIWRFRQEDISALMRGESPASTGSAA